jgi:peptidoglycan hydrolase-like protein with peptidoglycan-binding domain
MKTRSAMAALLVIPLALAGCGLFAGETDVAAAQAQFCADVEDYVRELDTYGGLFEEVELTVGDVEDAGQALDPARQAVLDSAQAFREAVEADPTPGIEIELVDPENITAVENAERAFDDAIAGIRPTTTVREAGAGFTSAAYALQVAWTRLFVDAGCLDEEGEAGARQWVSDYVRALQTDLRAAGYYTGGVDGIYGPATIEAVERLQEDAGLPVSGLVDPATQVALTAALAGRESAQVGALQGILISTGYYPGPVDGRWSPTLEEALKEFQTELGVPATGVVDTETLRAFELKLAEAGVPPPTTTTILDVTTTVAPETTTTAPPETTTTVVESTTTTVPEALPGILEVLAETGRFGQLLAAIEAAGLTDTLAGPGPFTLFAPPDEAFAALGEDVPSDPEALQALLLGHVVSQGLTAFELAELETVPTAGGGTVGVTLEEGFLVLDGSSTVTIANVVAGNGIVHVVNTVLTGTSG